MRTHFFTALWILSIALPVSAAELDPPRTFQFTYAGIVTGIPPGRVARIWLPVPSPTPEQQVQLLSPHLPAGAQLNEEPRYHNRILFFTALAGAARTISFSLDYQITRHATEGRAPPADADADALSRLCLQPDAEVPVGGKSLTLLAGKTLPADPDRLARLLYDTVDDDLQYRKDKPGWGRGDADWVCDSRFGNCTDFHSLFISMARGEHLPAQFEIGFALPAARGTGPVAGYHCWAWYLPPGRGWTPVDIALANQHPARRDYFFGNLDADRVGFTVGRDLTLTPPQAGPPLNFFIYPYAEVDGKPLPADQIKHSFTYTDAPVAKSE